MSVKKDCLCIIVCHYYSRGSGGISAEKRLGLRQAADMEDNPKGIPQQSPSYVKIDIRRDSSKR